MVHRLCKLSKSSSFFLFGARGTGKTSLLKAYFSLNNSQENDLPIIQNSNCVYINLLLPINETRFLKHPEELLQILKTVKNKKSWIIIDEIQKVPALLDLVHQLIENSEFKFALTGSSSRKLKRGGANLLAGRAFVYELFPLTHVELAENFDLQSCLQWGSLPKVLLNLSSDEDKTRFLQSYTQTYLKEEIQIEQLVRSLKPFLLFLDIAAQMNGKIVNYSKIARDLDSETTTVQSYFEILEETHLGYRLQAFQESLRKRQKTNPKFFYFDIGVMRSLNRVAQLPPTPRQLRIW